MPSIRAPSLPPPFNFMFQAKLADFITHSGEDCAALRLDFSFAAREGGREEEAAVGCQRRAKQVQKV